MSQRTLALWGILAGIVSGYSFMCQSTSRQTTKDIFRRSNLFIPFLSWVYFQCSSNLQSVFPWKRLREILEGDIVTLIIGGLAVLWVSGKRSFAEIILDA